MKIAYVLAEFPSASETFIAREIEALRRRGFEIEIWAMHAGSGAQEIPSSDGWNSLLKPLNRLSVAASRRYYRQLGSSWARQSRNQMKDVQHIHAGWASFPAWIAWGAGEVLGVPGSFSGHARDLWVDGCDLQDKLRAAKFATCCTREGTAFLESRLPESSGKVLYAPHGVEIERYEYSRRQVASSPVELLAVGRLVEKKGYLFLLEALELLNEKGNCLRLTIVGEGPQRAALEAACERQQTDSFVSLAGALSHEKAVAMMQKAHLFVMSSTPARDGDRDGLPNVLLEAAACGLPIVSTRAGAITDFLDESCAWLCEPGTPVALANAIQDAIEKYPKSLQRAEAARKRVEQMFDVDKNIAVLAQAFAA